MKRNKFLGVTLMVSALLLQVGYAAGVTVPSIAATANVDGYHVQFSKVSYEASPYVTVDIPQGKNYEKELIVSATGLYPGAYFTMQPTLQNQSQKNVAITDVKVTSTGMGEKEDFILTGYDGENKELSGGLEAYSSYLAEKYKGTELLANEEVDFNIKLGMKQEATEKAAQSASFKVEVLFEQLAESEGPSGGGGGTSSGGGSHNRPEPSLPPKTDVEVPDETVPGGAIDETTTPENQNGIDNMNVEDETVAGGSIKDSQGNENEKGTSNPNNLALVGDESVPGGTALPKTGGLAAGIVYAVGLGMLGSGFVLYKKKENDK